MHITVWNDYICPWAYAARPLTAWLRVEAAEYGRIVEQRSFELHPDIPSGGSIVRAGGRLDQVFDHITAMGERLRAGIVSAAAETGHAISYSGPPTMPTLLFANDPDLAIGRRFSREAAGRGAILHPLLNWNLSAAHTEADIDETLEIATASLAATPSWANARSRRSGARYENPSQRSHNPKVAG